MEPQPQPQNENQEPISKTTTTLVAASASHLTRPELLKRRLHNVNRLSNCYRALYWALIQHINTLYKDYVWDTGLSPFQEPSNQDVDRFHCAFCGCASNAMPLTIFCHQHILSDPNQKLYKPCNYLIKSAQGEPITCEKPILRSTVPSLCNVHMQKAEKHLTTALKSNGLSSSFSNKTPPKLHVVVTEFVNLIQAKRRELIKKGKKAEIVAQKENDNS